MALTLVRLRWTLTLNQWRRSPFTLVVSVLGVRIGYRQAKANFVLQASGISRFAGPGPLGVVRSGSFIALHTRTARTRTAAVVPLRSVSTAFDRAA